jgi:hypothetical protein
MPGASSTNRFCANEIWSPVNSTASLTCTPLIVVPAFEPRSRMKMPMPGRTRISACRGASSPSSSTRLQSLSEPRIRFSGIGMARPKYGPATPRSTTRGGPPRPLLSPSVVAPSLKAASGGVRTASSRSGLRMTFTDCRLTTSPSLSSARSLIGRALT